MLEFDRAEAGKTVVAVEGKTVVSPGGGTNGKMPPIALMEVVTEVTEVMESADMLKLPLP
jgi:hypothetical protein